jgi:hypothetical protein
LPLNISRDGNVHGTSHADQAGNRMLSRPGLMGRSRRVRRYCRYLLAPGTPFC